MCLRISFNGRIFFSCFFTFLFSSFAFAQWEGDLTKIGQSQAGGFDYQWKNFTSTELGPRTFTYNYVGARSLGHAPAAYVHPRIYFNPEDTTEIKNRLANTVNGREVMRKLHAYTTLLHLGYDGTKGGKFNRSAAYAVNSQNVCYMSNVGAFDAKWQYDKLVNNDTTGFVLKSIGTRFNAMLSMEAIECFFNKGKINPETGLSYNVEAANLAKAMTVWARVALKSGLLTPTTYPYIGGCFYAVMYDYNYWAMTPVQRDTARMALAKIVPTAPRWGDLTIDPYRTVSNWTTLNFFEVIPNFAIEGETGYNPTLTHKWMKVLYRFISYGYFDSGCGWEGIGKNYQMVAQLVASARRGYSLLGHPHVRAYAGYLSKQIQPFGYGFNGEDLWGGSGPEPMYGKYKFNQMDAIGLKFAYPTDTVADFVWRNYAAYTSNGVEYPDQAYVLTNGVTTTSFDPGTNNNLFDMMGALVPYVSDWFNMDWTTQNKAALKTTDFVDTERGQMVMRSGFDTNAMSAIFYCRQNTGGHTYPDRNSFTLSSLGRIWIPYRWGGYGFADSHAQNFVLVDTMAISYNGGNQIMPQPGKLLNWSTNATLPQVTGDATYAYSWEWTWSTATGDNTLLGKADPGKQAWTKVTETLNDFRKTPSTETFYSTSIYNWQSWNPSASPAGTYYDRFIKRPYNTMEKVYRTVSMIRGKHNGLLVIDDIKKDANSHKYQWVIQLPSDVTLDSKTDNGDGTYDAILKEASGNRRLMLRMLNQNDYQKGTAPTVKADTVAYISGDKKAYSVYRLVCTSNCVAPDFKVLLFPYLLGEAKPTTMWNADKSKLNVVWSDQTTSLAFAVTNGLTNLSEQTVQQITFPDILVKNTGIADFDPGATATSGLGVTYTSDNAAVATILYGKIHIVGIGTANITATQTGNATYGMAVPVTKTLTVKLINALNNLNADGVLTLSPNPAADKLLLNYSESINPATTVSVFNFQGKKIVSQKLSDFQTTLNVSNFPSGIYFVVISDVEKSVSGKFVKN
jgi:hypothetical protein